MIDLFKDPYRPTNYSSTEIRNKLESITNMDSKEIERLKQGEKLLSKINKITSQIESLRKVKFITLGTSKDIKVSSDRHWIDDHETEKVVDYKISINSEDKNPHPFAQPAWEFISTLINGMEHKKKELKKQFDEL